MSVSSPSVRSAAMILAVAILTMLPARSTSASQLQIIAPIPTLMPGQSETVSVQFTSTENFVLAAANIQISYDNTRFSVSNVQLGSLDTNTNTGYDYAITTNPLTSNPGVIYAGIDSDQFPASIATLQSGTLETFTLTALANAPLGGSPNNLALLVKETSGAMVPTAVYDENTGNAIVLSPAPGSPSNDATVTIAAAVPEPSSLILMGLGGGVVTLATVLRKRKARRPSAA
jgi:hypothetical protein